jgi:8-oxo-dGTP pyrophosphatase MutT (NUDIX family)
MDAFAAAESDPIKQGAVVILLDERGRVALQRRDKHVPFPNCWGLFGGWLEANETPLGAALREIEEELRISLLPSQILHLGTFTARIPRPYLELLGSAILIHVFRARISASMLLPRPAEGAGSAWRTADEVTDAQIVPYHHEILHLFADWRQRD